MYSDRTRACNYAIDPLRPLEGDESFEGASQLAGGQSYLQERSAPQQALLPSLVRDEETATTRVRDHVKRVLSVFSDDSVVNDATAFVQQNRQCGRVRVQRGQIRRREPFEKLGCSGPTEAVHMLASSFDAATGMICAL